MQSAYHSETADFEYHTRRIGKGVAMGAVDLDTLAGPGQTLIALSADYPAFFFGRYGIGVCFSGGLPQRFPFCFGPQGVGRGEILPKHGRPSRSETLVNIISTRSGNQVSRLSARMLPITSDKKRMVTIPNPPAL